MTVFQEVGIDSKLILTILVSFSAAEDVLSNGVKNMTFLAHKVYTENLLFRFLGGHPV